MENEEGEKIPAVINHKWHPDNWDIFWADSGATPEFVSSLGWW